MFEEPLEQFQKESLEELVETSLEEFIEELLTQFTKGLVNKIPKRNLAEKKLEDLFRETPENETFEGCSGRILGRTGCLSAGNNGRIPLKNP